MQKLTALSLALLSLSIMPALAANGMLTLPAPSAAGTSNTRSDIMPAPSRAPRAAVESSKLAGSAAESPAAMMGTAQALDGATLRLHDSARDVTARLLGVMAPPLTTAEGVAARTALDGLLKNQTLDCTRRDRDRDGSLVMSCSYNGGRDLSEAILFTGTTLFSRSPAVDNDLAVRYRAAEETAQARKLGLWNKVPTVTTAAAIPAVQAPVAMQDKPAAVAPAAQTTPQATGDSGFAFTTWLEAIGLLGVLFGMLVWLDTRHTRRARLTHELDIRADRQVLAAALTGELAAARDICEARAALITNGGAPTWPRLRTYIYQAHADQVGLLGAVLARQVASIYGQMADYGASNRGAAVDSDLTTPASVSRALVRLCNYIEITLEGLAEVEHTGEPYYPGNDQDERAEERHASQIAQRPQAAASLPQPQTAAPAPTNMPTTVPLKRLNAASSTISAADHGPNDDDDGEPAELPPEQPLFEATAKPTVPVETPATRPASRGTAAPAAAQSPSQTATQTASQTATQTRAARRTAMQKKVRAGDLFRAEQALKETNAELGVEELDTAADSKTA